MAKKKNTKEIDIFKQELREAMITLHTKRINRMMIEADDDDFKEMYFKLLPYVIPQLQKTENKNINDNKVIIKTDWVNELPKHTDSEASSQSDEYPEKQ